MKEQIYKICTQLNDGQIAVTEATEHLLDLFAVNGRCEQLCDFLEWYDEALTLEEREMDVKTYMDMKSHNCH